MKKILVYPKYSNPYQSLLYSEVEKNKDIEIKYFTDDIVTFGGYVLMAVLPFYLLKNRFLGFTIFHLHWVLFTPLSQSKVVQSISLLYVLFVILFIKLLGYKLVWTIHNIQPHVTVTANDMLITKFLCKMSNRKIVHSQVTITELKHLHCNTQNCVIIPHGNYIASYENTVTKQEAREYLNIDKNEFVFLFFGEIKIYKGIEDLLKVFSIISSETKHATLIIAGKVSDASVKQVIEQYEFNLKRKLITHLQHIHDKDIQYYMNAANVVVYPFKRITTSGSVLLALSFGTPIIYPMLGVLQEIPASVGFRYAASDDSGLYHSLKEAFLSGKETLSLKEKTSYNYANSLSWKKIAAQTVAIYQQV
ncbi:MAG TPA: glycosyltransferase [Candidatus Saccharimonadales bacterium]|nr:glycosyltransferase [Candidatus Saccharimonadales bacterium]